MNISNLLTTGSKILKINNIKTNDLDAELILAELLGDQRESLLINSEKKVSREIVNNFNKLITRRSKKEPIAYILNKREFWSKNFFVNRNVLIPRPETELLCEQIVKIFKNKSFNFLDIGTGTGCVLLSILIEIKNARGIGLDISKKALEVAKKKCKPTKSKLESKIFNKIFR